jgi:hypothetical protein
LGGGGRLAEAREVALDLAELLLGGVDAGRALGQLAARKKKKKGERGGWGKLERRVRVGRERRERENKKWERR